MGMGKHLTRNIPEGHVIYSACWEMSWAGLGMSPHFHSPHHHPLQQRERNSSSGPQGKKQTPHQGASRSLNLVAEFWMVLFCTLKQNVQILNSKEFSIVAERPVWFLTWKLIKRGCARLCIARNTNPKFKFKLKPSSPHAVSIRDKTKFHLLHYSF